MKGVLDSESWQQIEQSLVTDDMREKAQRAHHIYDIKRSIDAKNRVVVNGKRQHESTYSEIYSPPVSQTMLRLYLTVAANSIIKYSKWIIQMHTLIATFAISCLSSSPTDTQTPAMSQSCERHTTARNKVADDSTIKSPPTSAPPGLYNALMVRVSSGL